MKFKQLLKDKDITASQLARRLGISVSVVWKWCNEKSKPDVSYISKIASILGVASDDILACWEGTKEAQ